MMRRRRGWAARNVAQGARAGLVIDTSIPLGSASPLGPLGQAYEPTYVPITPPLDASIPPLGSASPGALGPLGQVFMPTPAPAVPDSERAWAVYAGALAKGRPSALLEALYQFYVTIATSEGKPSRSPSHARPTPTFAPGQEVYYTKTRNVRIAGDLVLPPYVFDRKSQSFSPEQLWTGSRVIPNGSRVRIESILDTTLESYTFDRLFRDYTAGPDLTASGFWALIRYSGRSQNPAGTRVFQDEFTGWVPLETLSIQPRTGFVARTRGTEARPEARTGVVLAPPIFTDPGLANRGLGTLGQYAEAQQLVPIDPRTGDTVRCVSPKGCALYPITARDRGISQGAVRRGSYVLDYTAPMLVMAGPFQLPLDLGIQEPIRTVSVRAGIPRLKPGDWVYHVRYSGPATHAATNARQSIVNREGYINAAHVRSA